MKNRSILLSRALAATLAVALVLPAAIAAQDGGEGFLFKRPRVTLGIRGGFAMPRAGSEIFDFTSNELTVETSDYYGATLGGTLAIRVTERFDISVDAGFSGTETLSEFRDWVDNDDLPIQQSTEFRRIPLTVSLKAYLWDRGQSIGRFAWVPRSWAPYVGAGGGVVWYQYEQKGDWVDYQTLDIFWDKYVTEGKAGTFHFLAGADYSITTRLIFTGEGRYSFGSAQMDQDFIDFDEIDLAGFQATFGFSIRL